MPRRVHLWLNRTLDFAPKSMLQVRLRRDRACKACLKHATTQVWMQTEFVHWRPVAVLPGNEAVSAVAWANPMGRPHDLVAVASHQTVTVFSLAGRADQLQVPH